jgi:hypothetical protein
MRFNCTGGFMLDYKLNDLVVYNNKVITGGQNILCKIVVLSYYQNNFTGALFYPIENKDKCIKAVVTQSDLDTVLRLNSYNRHINYDSCIVGSEVLSISSDHVFMLNFDFVVSKEESAPEIDAEDRGGLKYL